MGQSVDPRFVRDGVTIFSTVRPDFADTGPEEVFPSYVVL